MFAVSEEMIEATSRMEESSQVFLFFILVDSKKCKKSPRTTCRKSKERKVFNIFSAL
jgi:hypothetical protein